MSFYCIRPRGRVGLSTRPVDSGPNPYDPGSSRFVERHRQTETVLPGGTVRVDMGGPVPVRSTEASEPSPVPPAASPSEAPAIEPAPRPITPPRLHREPWGINRAEP